MKSSALKAATFHLKHLCHFCTLLLCNNSLLIMQKQKQITNCKQAKKKSLKYIFRSFFFLFETYPSAPLFSPPPNTNTHTPLLIPSYLLLKFRGPSRINKWSFLQLLSNISLYAGLLLSQGVVPPLKGFGPAVGSSLVPRHRAAAARMGLHDLARPR